jgi:hypothetical protein
MIRRYKPFLLVKSWPFLLFVAIAGDPYGGDKDDNADDAKLAELVPSHQI